jgi:hypothetical protein
MLNLTDVILFLIFAVILASIVEINNRDNPCHVRANHPSECNSDVKAVLG